MAKKQKTIEESTSQSKKATTNGTVTATAPEKPTRSRKAAGAAPGDPEPASPSEASMPVPEAVTPEPKKRARKPSVIAQDATGDVQATVETSEPAARPEPAQAPKKRKGAKADAAAPPTQPAPTLADVFAGYLQAFEDPAVHPARSRATAWSS